MPYSMKVRLLYFAHLYNIPLSPELEEDLAVILQKIPLLHGELISKTFIMERILLGLFLFAGEFPAIFFRFLVWS